MACVVDHAVDIPKVMDGNAEEESTEHHPQSCNDENGHGGVCAYQKISHSEDACEENEDG